MPEAIAPKVGLQPDNHRPAATAVAEMKAMTFDYGTSEWRGGGASFPLPPSLFHPEGVTPHA